jgi:hypothetical protein
MNDQDVLTYHPERGGETLSYLAAISNLLLLMDM